MSSKHVAGKAFAAIRGLPNFSDVEDRVVQGWPLSAVADAIQANGYLTEIRRDSLVRQLRRFRGSLAPGLLARSRVPLAYAKAMDDVEEKLNELNELVLLYRRQEARLEIDFAIEVAAGKLLPTLHQDILAATATLVKIAHLKRELGIRR